MVKLFSLVLLCFSSQVAAETTSNVEVTEIESLVVGQVNKMEIRDVIENHLVDIQYCYNSSYLNLPTQGVETMLKFSLSPFGQINYVSIDATTFSLRQSESCLENLFHKFSYPTPTDKNVATVYTRLNVVPIKQQNVCLAHELCADDSQGHDIYHDARDYVRANPDAGEGSKAKKEEGKVGKKDATRSVWAQAKGDPIEIYNEDIEQPNDEEVFVQSNQSGYGQGGGTVGKKRIVGTVQSGGSPIILGLLDKSLVDAVIRRNMSQIRYCYQRELTKNRSLRGKIIVQFTIAPDGSVSKTGIKSSSMGSPNVENCIAGRFKRFKFPEPKGGDVVVVSYPFLFSP